MLTAIGFDRALAHIKEVESNLDNPVDFKSQGAFLLVAAAQDSIMAQGPGWQPLDPDTIKRKHGRGSIGINSGAMFRSITAQFGADYVGVFYKKYYGRFFQRGEGGMPARPIKLNEHARQAILDQAKKAFGFKQT